MNEYTKGEWRIKGNKIEVLGSGVIAQCPSPQNGGVMSFIANAQLISASPDLYEALKGLEPTLVSLSDGTTITHPTMMGYAINALQALAKAEGNNE